MQERLRPELIAIVICDETIRDEATKKHTLVGLFNRITAKQFPCVHARLHVFVSLTNGHGKASGELRLVLRETNEPVLQLSVKIAFPTPLDVVEMDFDIYNLALPKPGRYSFDFLCNGELVGSRPFQVLSAQEAPSE